MREIKFRGKRIDSNEWVFFSLHDLAMNVGTVRAFGLVRTDTISQYTGLKDKNGLEIYDGDILAYTVLEDRSDGVDGIFEVKWFEQGWYEPFGNSDEYDEYRPWSNPSEDAEVVGNIYQTPEILKADELTKLIAGYEARLQEGGLGLFAEEIIREDLKKARSELDELEKGGDN